MIILDVLILILNIINIITIIFNKKANILNLETILNILLTAVCALRGICAGLQADWFDCIFYLAISIIWLIISILNIKEK